MELEKLLETKEGKKLLELAAGEKPVSGHLDLSRAKEIKVSRETYLEAQSRGVTLSELLETEDYDPSGINSPLDAFERQLVETKYKSYTFVKGKKIRQHPRESVFLNLES
ncbi:MAG: hypothetical protein ABII96_05200 [Candidatus Zixiibacteriota bacterium]